MQIFEKNSEPKKVRADKRTALLDSVCHQKISTFEKWLSLEPADQFGIKKTTTLSIFEFQARGVKYNAEMAESVVRIIDDPNFTLHQIKEALCCPRRKR